MIKFSVCLNRHVYVMLILLKLTDDDKGGYQAAFLLLRVKKVGQMSAK